MQWAPLRLLPKMIRTWFGQWWSSSNHMTNTDLVGSFNCRVLWCYAHPRTDHVTIWPAWNINTHWTFPLLWHTLLLWHFDLVTFYYCDTLPPLWYCHFVTVLDDHLVYLDCDRMSTFALKWNLDILSYVTGALQEVLWLVWQRVDEMSQWSNQGLILGHTN